MKEPSLLDLLKEQIQFWKKKPERQLRQEETELL